MLSICIITKNEQQNIASCLEALVPTGYEIVVVDTGSSDSTREIARRYTEQVYDFLWCDDFAAAKNYAISKAANSYVMVIDSDEFLESIDTKAVEQLIQSHPDQVGRIRRKNIYTRNGDKRETDEWINRIFSKQQFHYEGRIHEQVTALDGHDYEMYLCPVVIRHTGYDLTEEEKAAKTQRNIVLLDRELDRLVQRKKELEAMPTAETGSDHSLLFINAQLPYILYQLGKSYFMAGNYETASTYFSEALYYDLNPKLEYVIDMVETYGYALINSGQSQEALKFEGIYEEFGNSADFQFLMGLIYMNNHCFDDAVAEFQKAVKHSDCRTVGVNSYLAYYNIGVIYECLGNIDEAREYYKQCREYAPALKRLKEIGVK